MIEEAGGEKGVLVAGVSLGRMVAEGKRPRQMGRRRRACRGRVVWRIPNGRMGLDPLYTVHSAMRGEPAFESKSQARRL